MPNYFQPNAINSNREKSPKQWWTMAIWTKIAWGQGWCRKNSITLVKVKLDTRIIRQNVGKTTSYTSLALPVVWINYHYSGDRFQRSLLKNEAYTSKGAKYEIVWQVEDGEWVASLFHWNKYKTWQQPKRVTFLRKTIAENKIVVTLQLDSFKICLGGVFVFYFYEHAKNVLPKDD